MPVLQVGDLVLPYVLLCALNTPLAVTDAFQGAVVGLKLFFGRTEKPFSCFLLVLRGTPYRSALPVAI